MNPLNYFGEREQQTQKRFQQQRDRILGPLVDGLRFCRLTPNRISLLGVFMLAPFAVLVLRAPTPTSVGWACVFLLLHLLLDGLDGPLARRTGQADEAGAFVDVCCDHGGLILVCWVISGAGLADGTLTNVYVTLYTLLIVFTIWLNRLQRPFRVVLRTKYLLYLLLGVYGLTHVNLLNESMLAFSAYNLGLCALSGWRIWWTLKQGA